MSTGRNTTIRSVQTATAVVSAEVTRPADTTAYAAGDAIANSTSAPVPLTFDNAASAQGGGGYIVGAQLLTNQAANVAKYRLYLFNALPTATNDNAPLPLLWSRRASYVGYIDFEAATSGGTGSDAAQSQNDDVILPFVTVGAKVLYGLLVAVDAFTPASGQVFGVKLWVEQN